MTLIVGIRCLDGIVMAADGAATLGGGGALTAQQRTVKKLSIHRGKILIGASGAVGLSQRLRARIEDEYGANAFKGRPESAIGAMRDSLWSITKGEMESARAAAPLVHNAASSAIATLLVALPLNKEHHLVQFDEKCSPELASADLPFVALGSGQAVADPFLAFVRRIFWPRDCPPLQDGIFAAVWTLRHAIDTVPMGVAEPIQVCILAKSGGDWAARELEAAELAEHEQAVRDAEGRLREWRDQLGSEPGGDPPEPPPA